MKVVLRLFFPEGRTMFRMQKPGSSSDEEETFRNFLKRRISLFFLARATSVRRVDGRLKPLVVSVSSPSLPHPSPHVPAALHFGLQACLVFSRRLYSLDSVGARPSKLPDGGHPEVAAKGGGDESRSGERQPSAPHQEGAGGGRRRWPQPPTRFVRTPRSSWRVADRRAGRLCRIARSDALADGRYVGRVPEAPCRPVP